MVFGRGHSFFESDDAHLNRRLRNWYRYLYVKLPERRGKGVEEMKYTCYDFDKIMYESKKEYKATKKFVRHWSRIERKFDKMRTCFAPMFVIKFKHNDYSDIVYDDVNCIYRIANYYDYDVVSEDLTPKYSIYTFERRL